MHKVLPTYTAALLTGLLLTAPVTGVTAENSTPTYREVEGPVMTVDWIEGKELVIGDTVYQFTPTTRFFDLKGVPVGISSFQVGDYVKVVADEEFHLQNLYQAVKDEEREEPGGQEEQPLEGQRPVSPPEQPEEPSPSEPAGAAPADPGIHQNEQGVWTN
ncbi:MAG: hypothetical protein CSA34_03165 [Desulfobulbus propionicus]|nr:MAG: hypothetical protein CSA34_03165 [Desulfobulbus propionicus]